MNPSLVKQKIAAVARDDPEIAPKTAQLKHVATPSEPGIPVLSAFTPLYALRANPPMAAKDPIRMNSGMQAQVGDAMEK